MRSVFSHFELRYLLYSYHMHPRVAIAMDELMPPPEYLWSAAVVIIAAQCLIVHVCVIRWPTLPGRKLLPVFESEGAARGAPSLPPT